jgi:hypothetical protein
MLELAVDTANTEFAAFAAAVKGTGRKSRPMSSYVIFHVALFERLGRVGRGYSAARALEETLDEIIKVLPVYAQSGLPDYGKVWDVNPPRSTPPARPAEDPVTT